MARIRSIKPELWEDEALGRCPIGARLLFIGLISNADDHGRLRADPAFLRARIFPYDETLSSRRVHEWLDALVEANLVRTYTVSGQRYLDLPSWSRHQRVDNAGKPIHPAWDDRDQAPADPAPSQETDTGIPDSRRTAANRGEPPLEQGEGEGEGTESANALSSARAAPDTDQRVFNAWVDAGQLNPQRARLNDKRRRTIRARLREGYTVDDLIAAARGIWASKWHVENGHTELVQALRDGAHVERFRDLHNQNQPSADDEFVTELLRRRQLALAKEGAA